MDAIFIRHNMRGSTPKTIEQLWEQRLIALHYGDRWETEPEAYRANKGERPLRRLWDYCNSGGLVAADYPRKGGVKTMLVGKLESGTPVIASKFMDGDRGFIYKTAQLQRVTEISYADHPLLAAVQPPNVAICKWKSVKRYLETIVKGVNLPWSVDSLAPSQLEVLCYEYLRADNRIASLLLPIGRNLKYIDIIGINSRGQSIYAQVTASKKPKVIQQKVNLLAGYENAIMFAPEEMGRLITEAEFISIQDVFQQMSSDPAYHLVLQKMLNYPMVERTIG